MDMKFVSKEELSKDFPPKGVKGPITGNVGFHNTLDRQSKLGTYGIDIEKGERSYSPTNTELLNKL